MLKETINNFLHKTLGELKVAVIGDIMVDRYLFGDVNRISPEAPVPVNRITKVKSVLGGGANVASNLAQLSCSVYLAGLAGEDENGIALRKLVEAEGIDGSGICYSKSRKTTTKMRVLGDQQQMIRVDFEEYESVREEESKFILAWLRKLAMEGLNGIVISDYGKGLCSPALLKEIIAIAKEYDIVTVVDPKGQDWRRYRGATCITPNVKELSDVMGYPVANSSETIQEAVYQILEETKFPYVIVTRSAQGILAVTMEGQVCHSPATQQDVYDVSGAGDTVVATIVTAMAAHLPLRAMLALANRAAGIVVSKVGTYPVHRQELIDEWNEMMKANNTSQEGLSRLYDVVDKVKQWQQNGETVVFTNGCFDILHRGHVDYLREAAKLGERLIIAINNDDSVRRLKGASRPIIKAEDRGFILSQLRFVSAVIPFSEDTPKETLSILRPNILVKGGDYREEDVIGREFVDKVVIIPFVEGYSTTSIVEKIQEQGRD